MILDCHKTLTADANLHRQGDLVAAKAGIVEAAYAAGIADAIKRANAAAGHPPMSDHTIAEAFMVDWFIVDFILGRHRGPNRPIFTSEVDKLDLTPVEAAVRKRDEVEAGIRAERQLLRTADLDWIDRQFMDGACLENAPPGSAVTFADGTPRPLFHVTPFIEFSQFRPISHFGTAVAVSRHAASFGFADAEEMRVMRVWLDIRRPLRLPDGGTASSLWILREAMRAGVFGAGEVCDILGLEVSGPDDNKLMAFPVDANPPDTVDRLLANALRTHGFDGVVYANSVEGGGDSWINTEEAQVTVDAEWRYHQDLATPGFRLSGDHPAPVVVP